LSFVNWCRECISKWHGIKKGRALEEVDANFFMGLIMGWFEGQVDKKKGSLV
jgi:hypothetical protein